MTWLATIVEHDPKSILRVLSGALRVVLTALSYDVSKDQAIVGRAMAINSNLLTMIELVLSNICALMEH